MRPQIGMTIHYIPLDDDGKPAKPRPALVMGTDEHEPPNLDLQVFRPLSEGAGPEHMALVPPASSTITGSGWAWPEWLVTFDKDAPQPAGNVISKVAPRFDETAKPGDNHELREVTLARPGGPKAPDTTAAEDEAGRSREGQEGSVILLALGMIVVAGILSTALGL